MYTGYGMRYDNVKWKDDCQEIFYSTFAKNVPHIKEAFENYRKENGMDCTVSDFVDDYENDTYLWSGLQGLIADTINYMEFDGEVVFRVEDYCICVAPFIPEGDEDFAELPTKSAIREILATYVNPLLTEPVVVDWYDIYD